MLSLAVALVALAILVTAAYLAPAGGGLGTHEQLSLPACSWITLMELPCPTCGMTTAFAHAADGDLLASLAAQPLGAALAIITAMVLLLGLYVAATGAQLFSALTALWGPRTGWLLAGAVLAAWGYKVLTYKEFFVMVRWLPLLLVTSLFLGGCIVGELVGGMMQNAEYQKQVQVLPEYEGLAGRRVAVVVDAHLEMLYDHPDLVGKITSGVTKRIGVNVPGTQMMPEHIVMSWQWRTPQWNAMPYGEIAESLGVDRVVLIDLNEYRLNPPGNRWIWQGVCSANVHIIERDSIDPDLAIGPYPIAGEFPKIENVDRSGATAQQIEMGVLSEFIKKTAWLFHEHLEPKYPDKFRPELATQS